MPRGTVDTKLVKRGYEKTSYNKFMLQELKKCLTDPLYFMKTYVKIQHPTKGQMNFHMWQFQEDLINTYHNNRFSIALLPRQSGKTTCVAGYLLWRAMFRPDSTILVAAHQMSGAQEIMQRIRYAYEEVPDFIRAGVTEYNKGSIAFDNGSRIISQATTEKTGRGLSLSLIYLDEFAFVDPGKAAEFWTSISPTLTTGGDCIITSTPNRETDQFAQIWRDANNTQDEYGNEHPSGLGTNGFKGYHIDWKTVANCRGDDLSNFERSMRAQLGDDRWMREYECQFVSFEETLINPMILKDLQGEEPKYVNGRVRWYGNLKPNRVYVASHDVSMGTGGDYSTITVWMLPEFEQVAEWQHNKTDVKGQITVLLDILRDIQRELKGFSEQMENPEIYWSVENNSMGEAALHVIEDTGEDLFPGIFVHDPRGRRKGFTTTTRSKNEACSKAKNLIESGKIKIRSKNLIKELKSFVKTNKSYEAKGNDYDDLVDSLLLAIRIIDEIKLWDEKIYNTLGSVIDADEDSAPMPMII